MARPWSDDDLRRLRELVSERREFTDIAKLLGRTPASVAKKSQIEGLRKPASGRAIWTDPMIRAASTLDWPTFHRAHPEVTWDAFYSKRSRIEVPGLELTDYTNLVEEVEGDALICACVHVPQTDEIMWARALAIGHRDGIENLIVAGDIVTGDMFSKWETKEDWSFDKELESLRLHLVSALQVFPFIYITPGNHIQNRIVRITNGHIRLKHLIDMAGLLDAERERIFTTDLDYLTLISGEERFLVGHAGNYSRIDGRVALQYAEKMESHTITGNGHRSGYQVSRSARWHAWEIGMLADDRYMAYVQRGLTTFPRMMRSFATVRNGAVRLYGDGLPTTDWLAELGYGTTPTATPGRASRRHSAV